MLSAIFEQFVEESPVSVMARGLMERVFEPERMDRLFEKHAVEQYQQELLFSSQVDLMSGCALLPAGSRRASDAPGSMRNTSVSSCSLSSQGSFSKCKYNGAV